MRVKENFRYIEQDQNLYLIKYTLDERGYEFETVLDNDEGIIDIRLNSAAFVSLSGGGIS